MELLRFMRYDTKKLFAFPLFSLFFFIGCSPSDSKNAQKKTWPYSVHEPYKELKNTDNQPQHYQLSDQIKVILDSAATLRVAEDKTDTALLDLRGKAHFLISHSDIPVVIYTGMMRLETKSVNLVLNAPADSPGQSLKVFDGKLIATKSYKSDFPNTDTLSKGDLILINIDIDLMEKETFDTLTTKPSI